MRCGSTRSRPPHRSHCGEAPTRSTSTATDTPISPYCATGRTSCSAAVVTVLRARQRGARPRRRRHVDGGVQRDVGRVERPAHARVRRLPAADRGRVRDSQLVRPRRRQRYAAAARAHPGPLHAVDAVQRLEPLGPARPAGEQRPELLPRRLGSALADVAGPAPALTARPTAGGRSRSGAWASPAGTYRRRLPEVYLTSQGDNKLQTLVEGRRGRRTRTSRSRAGVTAHAVHRRRRAPVDRVASRVRGRRTTTASSTCSSPRATSKRSPTTRSVIRATCCSARRTARSREAAEAAGIVSYERGRGAALVDLNLDGLLDLVVVHRRENVTVWRNAAPAMPKAGGDGPLARAPAATAGAERRRDRRLGGRADRRSDRRPVRSRSAAVTQAGSSAGSTSASGKSEQCGRPGAVARRRDGTVDAARRPIGSSTIDPGRRRDLSIPPNG